MLRMCIDYEEAFPDSVLLNIFFGAFGFFYLNVVPFGKKQQCFAVGEVLVLHNKAHHISRATTAKTFVDALAGRYVEGRRFFVVKGAESQIIGASFLNGHKVADYLFHTGGIHNAVYSVFCDHVRQKYAGCASRVI